MPYAKVMELIKDGKLDARTHEYKLPSLALKAWVKLNSLLLEHHKESGKTCDQT